MERILALMACMLPELFVVLEIFEVNRPGTAVVAVFCQALSVFPVWDGGDLFPGYSATNLLPLMLGFFLTLLPDFDQVFVKGRRPFWSENFCLDA